MGVKETEICEIEYTDREKVESARKQMPLDEHLDELSEMFKALASRVRVRILFALSAEELCVCDLANFLELSVSAVSHHLRLLRLLKVIKYRKEGLKVYYSLDDEHIEHLLVDALEHMRH